MASHFSLLKPRSCSSVEEQCSSDLNSLWSEDLKGGEVNRPLGPEHLAVRAPEMAITSASLRAVLGAFVSASELPSWFWPQK